MRLALGSLAIALLAAIAWLAWPRAGGAAPAPPAAAAIPAPARAATTAATAEPEREPAIASANEQGPKRVFGDVRDDEKNALAGAAVKVFASPKSSGATPLAEMRTDAGGRYEIAVDPTWPTVLAVEAGATGHLPRIRDGVTPAARIDLELSRLVVVFGRVLAHGSNAPLVGAELTEVATDGGAPDATCDAEGRYELTLPMTRGGSWLGARHAGYCDERREIRVHGRERTEVDFVLRPAVTITVQVVDAVTGKPIAGAEVGHTATDVFAHTDEQGRCKSSPTAEGQQLGLTVRAEGYGETMWSWQVNDAASVAPRIPLLRLATIAGRVSDTGDHPLEGASVSAAPRDMFEVRDVPAPPGETWAPGVLSFASGDHGTRTDTQGLFTLAVLPGAPQLVVTARHDDHVETRSEPIVVDRAGARAWIELKLTRGATLHGIVRRNGKPLPACTVTWDSKSQRRLGGMAMVHGTDEYTLRGVAPGEVSLRLDELGRGTLQRSTLQLEAGQTLRHDFVWEEKVAPITGKVTSTDGRPLANIAMHVLSEHPTDRHSASTETGADGRYSIACAEGSTYMVTALRGPVRKTREKVAAGTGDVDFVLPELGLLRVKLIDANTREPIRLAGDLHLWSIAWRESGNGNFIAVHDQIDAAGRVEMRLPRGGIDLSIWAQAAGCSPRTVQGLPVTAEPTPTPIPIELTRGANVELDLDASTPLPRDVAAQHLVFFVDDSQAALLRGPFAEQGGDCNHRINGINMWLGEPGLMHRLASFGDGGPVTLKGLVPGRHWLRVFPDDLVFEPASFDVTASGGKFVVRWRRR